MLEEEVQQKIGNIERDKQQIEELVYTQKMQIAAVEQQNADLEQRAKVLQEQLKSVLQDVRAIQTEINS